LISVSLKGGEAMRRHIFSHLAILASFQFIFAFILASPSLAQEWEIQKARGTITVVDLFQPTVSVMLNYAEALVPY
jgi:hypothetical protein